MTIKVEKVTKAAMDIFAAKEYARTGKALTNDEAILALLEAVDPGAVEQAKTASVSVVKPRSGRSDSKN